MYIAKPLLPFLRVIPQYRQPGLLPAFLALFKAMAVVGCHIGGKDNQGYGQRGAQVSYPVGQLTHQSEKGIEGGERNPNSYYFFQSGKQMSNDNLEEEYCIVSTDLFSISPHFAITSPYRAYFHTNTV